VPAVVAGSFAFLHGTAGGDTSLFVTAGRTLLSTHWSHAFANSEIQVGPLQLAIFGTIGRSGIALAVVLAVATVLLLLLATARTVGVRNPLFRGTLGLIAVAVGFTSAGYIYGHPADAVLPLLWILAAVDIRRGHAVRAGALVGLTAGLQTWGILGVAVLALAPRWREAGKGVLAAAGIATVLFVPFVLGGHFAMGSYSWNVDPQTFLSPLVARGVQYGWSLRLLQGAFA
jgi:Glycosyltransferase family 87